MSKFEHGYGVLIDPGSDKPILEQKSTQCVHCGGHFPLCPGSGKLRGFCYNCNGLVCGPGCANCVPMERMLEEMEGTKNPTAVSVAVPRSLYVPGLGEVPKLLPHN